MRKAAVLCPGSHGFEFLHLKQTEHRHFHQVRDRQEGNLHSQLETLCTARKILKSTCPGYTEATQRTTVSLKAKPSCFSMHPYLTFLDHSGVSRLIKQIDSTTVNVTASQPQASISATFQNYLGTKIWTCINWQLVYSLKERCSPLGLLDCKTNLALHEEPTRAVTSS